jgi:hypothetical protein
MDKPKLSDREAALIAGARRELAIDRRPETGAAPTRLSESAAVARQVRPASAPQDSPLPATRQDAAQRIAALIQAEQEETLRRKKKLRQYGILIPASIMIAALIWVAAAIWRYAKI